MPTDLVDQLDHADTPQESKEAYKIAPPKAPFDSAKHVEETIEILKEIFPWWFRKPEGPRMPKPLRITHFINFHGYHVPATAENYAADIAPYAAEVIEKISMAAQSTNDHDRNAYALQAGMYATRAVRNASRALELGFKFPEIEG